MTSGFTPSAYKPQGDMAAGISGTSEAFGSSRVYEVDGSFGQQGGMSPGVSEMSGSVPGSPMLVRDGLGGRNF